MLLLPDIAEMQRAQYAHDMRNHFDILSLHKTDRLKHYGLHFAKYAGRLARNSSRDNSLERTIVDAFLIALSTANTLNQDLSRETLSCSQIEHEDPLRTYTDAAGRFADACEKIDHLEDFFSTARIANRDIVAWLMRRTFEIDLNVAEAINRRRSDLAKRHFYIG